MLNVPDNAGLRNVHETEHGGWEDGFYFADDWRMTRKLTLNLGLRWEYYSPYVEVADRIANFDADTVTLTVAP